MRVTALARSWSICVILSDHCIIVSHLNDKWFFFHKLYHPKLLWFINMVQWYSEILILVHFASDGTQLSDLEAYKNNNNNNNNNELKKFYRTFIVYRLCLDNLDISSVQYCKKNSWSCESEKNLLRFLANNLILKSLSITIS